MTIASLETASTAPVWEEPVFSRTQLTKSITVDTVVVGAGYTGLWTAYYLASAAPDMRIAVIDEKYVGFGASGRNGGWASAIFPLSLSKVAKKSSHRSAVALQHAMNDTVDEIQRVLETHDVQADFDKSGYLSLIRTDAQLQRAHAAVKSSSSFLGTEDQWAVLSPSETKAIIDVHQCQGALYSPHCAVIHPGKLVRGLAGVVENLGVKIFERTAAEDIRHGFVRTPGGTIRATNVVVATEGFTPRIPQLRRHLAPLHSLVVATGPLDPQQLSDNGIHKRTAFNDMRNMRIYAQATRDNRIVFGGRGAPYHFGSKVTADFDQNQAIHRRITETMLEFFPNLEGVQITNRWGGALGVPRDWHPSVSFNQRTGMGWAGSYVGDGVATSNLAGRILRSQILGEETSETQLPIANHASPRWEPEPLRWMGINIGLKAASLGDAEEKLTGSPSRIVKTLEAFTGAH